MIQIIVGGEMITGAVARRVDDDQFKVGLKSHSEPERAREQIHDWLMDVVGQEHGWYHKQS